MAKKNKKIVLAHFTCPGSDGSDSPADGFEVLKENGTGYKPNDFLLDGDVENLREQGVRVVVAQEVFP